MLRTTYDEERAMKTIPYRGPLRGDKATSVDLDPWVIIVDITSDRYLVFAKACLATQECLTSVINR